VPTTRITPSERKAAGKAARSRAPRSGHGDWQPSPDRPDPVETLGRQDATRVPELVPIRHGRMLASPLSFYRGAAAIMAADLGAVPNTGLEVQLCGDAHLSNFGAFMAPDRRLIFDINDFDETVPGPFEWDVKRLAASFAVAARHLGFKSGKRQKVETTAAGEYRKEIRRLASMRDLDIWYSRVDVDTVEHFRSHMAANRGKQLDRTVAKAERKNSLRALEKLTRPDGDSLRIISDPPLIVPLTELAEEQGIKVDLKPLLEGLIEEYRRSVHPEVRRLVDRYRYVDAAHKVVGVGSVGTRCWIVLLLGRDEEDPLFLQVKETGPSVLEPYAGHQGFRHQGRRVVEGQRLMQAASDILLGWLTGPGLVGQGLGRVGKREFYVRQLWDGKGSAEIERFDVEGMQVYATLCGGTLARAHARSGDPIEIASYLGGGDGFDRAIADFSEAYADQNEQDFKAFSAAADSGRIEARADL
jgi:Uncharacterized protein conserved in bacteria (DUF2252)